jgi:hypothetical protein
VNTTDKIVTALTPGSIFNRNGLIFRSLDSLAAFAEVEKDEVLDLLNGDLSDLVTCKPSAKHKGLLVALTAHVPAEVDDGPIAIVAGPVAPGLPDLAEDENMEVEEVIDEPAQ